MDVMIEKVDKNSDNNKSQRGNNMGKKEMNVRLWGEDKA